MTHDYSLRSSFLGSPSYTYGEERFTLKCKAQASSRCKPQTTHPFTLTLAILPCLPREQQAPYHSTDSAVASLNLLYLSFVDQGATSFSSWKEFSKLKFVSLQLTMVSSVTSFLKWRNDAARIFWPCILLGSILLCGYAAKESDDLLLGNAQSSFSRNMASSTSQVTNPSEPRVKRSKFPESNDPHICLAFLSCCDRTDLLNHTLAGIIRHMEEDEPSSLKYEIAWVDNGSDPEQTKQIADTYQIEHALRLPQNMGLAYGMNLLIFNLCKAPYILLLEEDWLYLDELVAEQTPQRKRVIATSLALLQTTEANDIRAFDERNIMGVFLRHESYDRFLQFPLMDIWETIESVDIAKELESIYKKEDEETCDDTQSTMTSAADSTVDIDYRIFCGDTSFQTESIWYVNSTSKDSLACFEAVT